MKHRVRLLPVLWLALALLGAQGLGLWHAVLHAPGAGWGVALAQGTGPDAGHDHGDAFDDHAAGDAECRLFDQLLQDHALATAPVELACVAAVPAPAAMALYAARLATLWGPPARGPPAGRGSA